MQRRQRKLTCIWGICMSTVKICVVLWSAHVTYFVVMDTCTSPKYCFQVQAALYLMHAYPGNVNQTWLETEGLWVCCHVNGRQLDTKFAKNAEKCIYTYNIQITQAFTLDKLKLNINIAFSDLQNVIKIMKWFVS